MIELLQKQEVLPFTIRVVSDEESLAKAVKIRHEAYSRHLPDFATTLQKPEKEDYQKDVVVFLAECKKDGSPIGTMRIQTNEFRSLLMEQSVDLPKWITSSAVAEATRLGIKNNEYHHIITSAILKANYLYCVENALDYMIVAARRPVNKLYERLYFNDVFPEFLPMKHACNLEHKILSFNVHTGQEQFRINNHKNKEFYLAKQHDDICVKANRWI